MGNVNLNDCEDDSMPTLNLGRSLDYMQSEQHEELLSLAIKKLKFNGKLIITCLELLAFCNFVVFGHENYDPRILYNVKSINRIDDIKSILSKYGAKILSTRIHSGLYTLEITK